VSPERTLNKRKDPRQNKLSESGLDKVGGMSQ